MTGFVPQTDATASFGVGALKASGNWRHGLLLFVVGVLWGLQLTLLKIAAGSSLGELGILTVCMVLLAAAYMAAVAIKKVWFRPTRRHSQFFLISGLFGYVLPLGGVILVADYLSAGLIVLFSEALIPVFTVAIALVLRTERVTTGRLAAVAVALSGVAVALWPELLSSTSARQEGLLLFFIIPLAYAIDGVYVAARWPEDLSPLQVVAGEAMAAVAMLLPFWFMFEGFTGLPESFGPGEWAILAFVPVTYVEVYLYFYLLRTVGAVFVSFGCFVSLFAGFLWGMTLLGEQPRPSVWIAVGLVVLALYMISVKGRGREPAPAVKPVSG